MRPPSDPRPIDDEKASSQLLEQVYDQLRSIAQSQLSRESAGHTLQATALVNEAYLKLRERYSILVQDRGAFVRAAATAMRRILIDHARARGRDKRGGQLKREFADVAEFAANNNPEEILALDDAICRLEEQDPKAAEVVKLRFFAGLSVEETAEVLGVSPRSVKREWQYARAWLYRQFEP
jgi:RNA polymerase sigma factor (TIGR02999 family)